MQVQTDPFRGEVPRDDVAAVLDAVLQDPRASGHVLYVNGGEDPVAEALDSVLAGG